MTDQEIIETFEREISENQRGKTMLAKPIRYAWGFIKVVLVTVFVLIVLLWFGAAMAECPAWACPNTRDIVVPSDTGIGGRIVGNLYVPYPGARTQIRSGNFLDNRIRAYIEPDGTITDPDTRQGLGNVGEPFGIRGR